MFNFALVIWNNLFFLQILFVITIIFPILLGVTNGRTTSKSGTLPFTCPLKFDDAIDPNLPDRVKGGFSDDVYLEYRAALAVVPCDADPKGVYIEESLNTEFTVSVVYLYDKSLRDLEEWLE